MFTNEYVDYTKLHIYKISKIYRHTDTFDLLSKMFAKFAKVASKCRVKMEDADHYRQQ